MTEPDKIFLLDRDLPPEIREKDLLLVDRSADRGGGLYVFSIPTGLAVKRVQIGLRKGLVVPGPGISEELDPMEIDQKLGLQIAGNIVT